MTEATPKVAQDNPPQTSNQSKTWYPYVTKTQFEKFLARLENKFPEQIDRDYVRALIRTPSMIYRFLRGIEAMRLIDREQHPTERLGRLVVQQLRRFTIADILRDLYGDLLKSWQEANESMTDDEMIDFFRARTGMGRDSANKMKMFFKYLLSEADFGEPPVLSEPLPGPPAAPPPSPPSVEQPAKPAPAPQQTAPAPAVEASQEKRQVRDHRSVPQPQRNAPQRTPEQPPQRASEQPQPRTQEAPQPRVQESPQPRSQEPLPSRGLTEVQTAYLQTLQNIVRINIDGEWDEEMIRSAFDRLERLFDRIRRG